MATSEMEGVTEVDGRFMYRLQATLKELVSPYIKEIYNHCAGSRKNGESLIENIRRRTGMSLDKFEETFNASLIDLFVSDPSTDSFDIVDWYTLLQHGGCVGLAPYKDKAWINPGTLENNLKRIKDFRNNLVFSGFSITELEFHQKLEELRKLLVDTARLAQSRFSVDELEVSRVINWFHLRFNDIRDNQLEHIDWTSPAVIRFIDILKSEGRMELQTTLNSYSIVNPASLIFGRNLQTEVSEIFTPLRIIEEGAQHTNETVFVDDILEIAHTKDASIILLEGIAGSGKTTLVKRMLSCWLRGRTMKKIDEYDTFFPIECRDILYKTVAMVAGSLMPETRKQFYEDQHFTTCLLGCKSLFVFDGVDEITQESSEVLSDLFKMAERRNQMTILLTARPEKIQEIYENIPFGQESVLHLRIDGVADIYQGDFITKYHSRLRDLGVSTQCNANGLLTYLRTTGARLTDQLTLPLNLTLVTLLWGIDNDRIFSITCPTELSIALKQITIVRLEERVVQRIEFEEFEEKIMDFFTLLFEIAMFGIRDSDLLVPKSEIQRLKKNCAISNLPIDELLGTFLVQRRFLDSNVVFFFPNKSGQQYYAAMYIYNQAFCIQPDDQPNKTITEVLLEVNREVANPLSFDTYKGTLVSLLGILHYKKEVVTDVCACELIGLFQNTGVAEPQHWIAMLNSVKCESTIVKTLIKTVPLGGEVCGTLRVNDSNSFAYATLLEHVEPKKLELMIGENGEKPCNIPRMEELMTHVAQRSLPISLLQLAYPFRHPCSERFKSWVNAVVKKCKVQDVYMGHIPSEEGEILKGLDEVASLWVSLQSPEDADSLFKFLRQRAQLQRPLLQLAINVGDNIIGTMLQSVPEGATEALSVFLPGITDDNQEEGRRGHRFVGDILRILNPPEFKRAFYDLCFPRYLEPISSWQCDGGFRHIPGIGDTQRDGENTFRLLHSLQGVCQVSCCVRFPSTCKPREEFKETELQEDCKRILQCSHGIQWGDDSDMITNMDSWNWQSRI